MQDTMQDNFDVFERVAKRARRIVRRNPRIGTWAAFQAALRSAPARYDDMPRYVGRIRLRDGRIRLWLIGALDERAFSRVRDKLDAALCAALEDAVRKERASLSIYWEDSLVRLRAGKENPWEPWDKYAPEARFARARATRLAHAAYWRGMRAVVREEVLADAAQSAYWSALSAYRD